jgi:nucleoside-diphosphate-sugar epimerase
MPAIERPVVLITGCMGLLGTAIARVLAPEYRIVGFDVTDPAKDWTGADYLRADLTDDDALAGAFDQLKERHGSQLASVIHLAAYYDFSGEDSPLYDELTVGGTRRLLEHLQDGVRTEQFAFASSLLVMKPAEAGELLHEDSPTEALWLYPRSKLEAERVIRSERGEVPSVILRIAGVYDDTGHSIPIAQQVARIREKSLESLFFPGNPHHGQTFVHLDDVADCVRRVVLRRHALAGLERFLVGETDVMSYGELQDRIGALLHDKEWPSIRIPGPVAKAGAWLKEKLDEDAFIKPWMVDLADAHYPVSVDRARQLLGWVPRRRLRDRLAAIVEALEADPQAWYADHGLPMPSGVEP